MFRGGLSFRGSPGRHEQSKPADRPGKGAQTGIGAASLLKPGQIEQEAATDSAPVVPTGVVEPVAAAARYIVRLLNSSLAKYLLTKWEDRIRQIVQHVRLPSHIDPPLTAVYFDTGGVGTTSVSNDGVFTTVASKTIDVNERGEIRWFGQQISTPGGYSWLTWRILVAGNPVPEYNGITSQLGSFNRPAPVMIHVPGGAKVEVQVKNVHTAESIACKATLRGWRFVPHFANRGGIIGSLSDVE